MAVEAELNRASEAVPLRERFAALRRAHPPPPPTGAFADKAFFDELSGNLDDLCRCVSADRHHRGRLKVHRALGKRRVLT